jgi:hypothetical protein
LRRNRFGESACILLNFEPITFGGRSKLQFFPRRSLAVMVVICGALLCPVSGQQVLKSDFRDLEFLVGDWSGEGGGAPGQGIGRFSFSLDLQGSVLIRKSYADYPATSNKPAYRHDDFMIVFKESDSKQVRAAFFDNEGHAINYSVRSLENGSGVEFLSDAAAASPCFRLTYQRTGSDTLNLRFEIAPPSTPNTFQTYINATARRQKSGFNQPNAGRTLWQFDTKG